MPGRGGGGDFPVLPNRLCAAKLFSVSQFLTEYTAVKRFEPRSRFKSRPSMIIQVNVVLRHCRQQQPYSGLRIHPHDHTQPTYESIQFCYLVCSDEQGVFLGRSFAQGVMFGKVQSFVGNKN